MIALRGRNTNYRLARFGFEPYSAPSSFGVAAFFAFRQPLARAASGFSFFASRSTKFWSMSISLRRPISAIRGAR